MLPEFIGSLSGTSLSSRMSIKAWQISCQVKAAGEACQLDAQLVSQLLPMPLCSLCLPVQLDFLLLVRCSLWVSQWESEGDSLFSCRYWQLVNSAPRAAANCSQTFGKVAFRIISVLIKPLYPINLLATGYFALCSVMFPEIEQVIKVPLGLTSNVFLDELQPGRLHGRFWKVKSIKLFSKIMFFSSRIANITDWNLCLSVGVSVFKPVCWFFFFPGISKSHFDNEGPSLGQVLLNQTVSIRLKCKVEPTELVILKWWPLSGGLPFKHSSPKSAVHNN